VKSIYQHITTLNSPFISDSVSLITIREKKQTIIIICRQSSVGQDCTHNRSSVHVVHFVPLLRTKCYFTVLAPLPSSSTEGSMAFLCGELVKMISNIFGTTTFNIQSKELVNYVIYNFYNISMKTVIDNVKVYSFTSATNKT